MTSVRTIVDRIERGDPGSPVYLQQWWFQEDCEALLHDLIVARPGWEREA